MGLGSWRRWRRQGHREAQRQGGRQFDRVERVLRDAGDLFVGTVRAVSWFLEPEPRTSGPRGHQREGGVRVRRMNLLHVIHRYPPAIGGSEAWCGGLARWQAGQGHRVRVLTLRALTDDELWGAGGQAAMPGARGATADDEGVSVRRCAYSAAGSAATHVLQRLGLPGFTRGLSPEMYGSMVREARWADVVLAHAVPGAHCFVAWASARLARRPFVLVPHFQIGDPLHEARAVQWLLRRADAVVTVTEQEASALRARGVRVGRIVVASNALEPAVAAERAPLAVRSALGVPSDAPLVCFLGRKAPTKGLPVLFEAMVRVRHQPAPVLCAVGPSTRWYESVAKPEGLRLVELPAVSEREKQEILAAADLLVLPSEREAFGIVFLEAWRAGTPVLGVDIPAVREVIGDAGYVFRAGDAADLAERIDEALENAGEASAKAERGRRRVGQSHTWPRVGSIVTKALEEVRARHAARRPGSEARRRAPHAAGSDRG